MLLSGNDIFYILKTCLISFARVKLAWEVMKLSFFYPFLPYSAVTIGKIFKKLSFNFGIFVNQSLSDVAKLICLENSVLATDGGQERAL